MRLVGSTAVVTDALDHALALGERGVQVAAYVGDELVVDAWAGTADATGEQPVAADTLFSVFSVTKAITVTALHMQVDRGVLSYDDRVADVWPEYGVNGKERTTIRDAVTHRSGAPQMPADVTPEQMCDWDWMVEQIAAMVPAHEPGTKSAYHSIVFGWLIGEIVRRTDPAQRAFGQFVRDEICTPLAIDDLWLGVPDDVLPRVAFLTSDVPDTEDTDPLSRAAKPASVPLTPELYNRDDVRRACLPGAGGIMSARAGARFFAMLANRGELDGVRLLSEDLLWSLTESRSRADEIDLVMAGGGKVAVPLSQGGYWKADLVAGNAPHLLCHGGMGGSIGWADLDTRVAVAICHNRMFQIPALDASHPYAALRRALDAVTS